MNRKTIRLDIGAGDQPRDPERFTTVDVEGNPDVKAHMWDLPFPDNSVEEIWSSHALEHVPVAKVPETLKEWMRVLKPGARAIISVPNFDYVAKYWLTGADRPWAEAMVFGLQRNEGDFHRCAFTNQVLKADCEAAGFDVRRIEIRWSYNQETLQATCVKPLKPRK